MAFPTSPTDGQLHQNYVYNSSEGVWDKTDPTKYYPIGFIYVQYPGKSDPSTLGWYGTWTNVSSNYAGDFFRAEGGDASAFESGEQLDQNKYHRHDFSYERRTADGNSSSYKTDVTSSGYTKYTSYNGGDEARPVNRTIRVWERTA